MSYIAFVSLSSSMMLSSPYARNGFLVFHLRFPCIPVTVLQLSMTGVCVCMHARTLCENVCAVHRVGVWLLLYTEVNASLRAKCLLKLCTLNECWNVPVVPNTLQFQICSISVPQFTGLLICMQPDCNCNRHSPGMWVYLTMSVEIKLCSRNMPPSIGLIFFLAPFLFVDTEFGTWLNVWFFFFFYLAVLR